MQDDTTFSALRSLLQQPPSEDIWYAIVDMLDVIVAPSDELLDYVLAVAGGQGDIVEADTRGAVAETALLQVQPPVEARLRHGTGDGGAGVYLTRERALAAGQHRFALVVVDDQGNESAPDVLTVTVRATLAPPIRLRTPATAKVAVGDTLILTAADSVEQRVQGLDAGADDYMAKPFDLKELEARVRALARRGTGGGASIWKHGPLTFDQVGRIAYINDDMLDLSAREVGLLEVLLQRVGRLVSKEQFVDHLCEWGEEVSNNAIEVYIHRLRKKIEVNGVRIATVRGLGYCLEKFVEKEATPDANANANT